jgi:hypothetical protein
MPRDTKRHQIEPILLSRDEGRQGLNYACKYPLSLGWVLGWGHCTHKKTKLLKSVIHIGTFIILYSNNINAVAVNGRVVLFIGKIVNRRSLFLLDILKYKPNF